MKRTLLAASILSVFFLYQSALAVEAHHPATDEAAPAEMKKDMEKVDTSVQKMQEMRKKIETEKNPAARQEMMQQHMQMMQECMQMMPMMGGMGMMGDGNMHMDPGQTQMKKMDPHEGMMGQGGGMMGGHSDKAIEDRMNMMEHKMMLMQEIMNGMMTQQQMKAK